MFGADAGQPVYSAGPGYADAPVDPAFADISPRDQDRLLDQATTRRREGESLSRGALESGVREATRGLTTIGRHDAPLPGIADFTKAYGPQAGARRHADFQRVVSLDAGGKTTGGPTDASFASPAAAANAPAGPAPMRSLSGPAIDLGPAAAQALGSGLTGDERSNRAETVRTRMIEDAMRSNGGDRPAAVAQTDRDLASLQGDGWTPGMFMRAPMAGAGTQFAFQNTTNNPAFPGATKNDGASRIPGPLPGGKSNIGKGLGAGLPGMIGSEISNGIWPQPEEGSGNYPDTSIRKSYHVSVDPLGKVFVPPAITRLFLNGLKDFAPDLPAEFRERSVSIEIGNVNSAIQDARFQLMRAERQGDPQPYYTATSWDGLSYDIAFAPTREADGTVTVTAIRPRGRLTNWAQQAIGQKDPMPGAWWGAPPKPLWKADAPQSDPIPIGPPGIPNASPAPEPSFAPPVWSEVDPYDKVTFDAELRRTGNRALALETAKAAHRAQVAKTAIEKKPIIGKNDKLPSGQSPSAAPPLINSPSNISQTRPDAGITSGDVDKNKLATKNRPVFQLPPPSVNEPYDPNDFQQLTGIGKSPELAFETAKELHQLKKEGLGKISVTGKGLTAPNIPKIPPPEPVNGLINPKFGKVVIRWGDTPEDALDRRSEIDAAEIAKFKSFGITKDTIIGWEATYKNDFKRNHNNYMALARYKLMSKILEQWGD